MAIEFIPAAQGSQNTGSVSITDNTLYANPKEPAQKETKPAPAGKPKPTGEVAPKDQDLDNLLENLGKTTEKPAENDQKPGGAGGSDDSMPPRSDKPKPKPEDLNDGEKDVDKKLIEITGKKEAPKKNQKKGQGQGQGGDPESGPLGQVIKEMREVEERLGKPDTGEATRKKQTEIVKNLDQLIEQVKNSPNPSMRMKMIRGGQKPGNQPGQQPGDQTGAMAQGAQKTKPTDPKKPTGIAGLNKDVWGGLPANMRDLMGNAESELPLPAKIEMIRRYYLSLGNKSAKAGD